MKQDDLEIILPQETLPHSEMKKSNYEKLGEKRKVKQEFSCANKDWLKRSDIVEVTTGETKPVYFSAAMAKNMPSFTCSLYTSAKVEYGAIVF